MDRLRNRARNGGGTPYAGYMAIIRALLAFLADHVMNSVATSRQTYLAEFGHYLDRRGFGK